MPCYTINLVSIELKQENINLVMETLQQMGLNPILNASKNFISTTIGNFDFTSKQIRVNRRYTGKVNQFKVNYSKNALKLAAKKNKWILKERSNNKYVAVKY